MKNWHDTTGLIQSECHWEDDLMFAEMVAKTRNSFYQVDLSEQYRSVLIICLQSMKRAGHQTLMFYAIKRSSLTALPGRQKLGGDFVATGHYCRKDNIEKTERHYTDCLQGSMKIRIRVISFVRSVSISLPIPVPIGNLTKPEVRAIADKTALLRAGKIHREYVL